jgi:dihydrofolate reductase
MAIALIAALDRNRAIGRAGELPWHLPDDLKRFKALTLGGTILMGRTTAESIGRALPGRRNLVLTRRGTAPYPGQEAVNSLAAAQALAGTADLLVVGGGEVYGLALPLADRLHLTLVDTEVAGADAWFPAWSAARWREVARAVHERDVLHAHTFSFVDYCLRE